MNPLSDWLAQPLVPRVGWTLVHFLWQGSAIAALFAMAQVALQKRSAQARYLAGCFALALMVLAPCATFARLNEKAGPPSQAATADDSMGAHARKESSLGNAIAGSATSMNRLNWSASRIDTVLSWLVVAWMVGVWTLGARLAGGWWQAQRLRTRQVESIDERWLSKLEELKRRLDITRTVRLLKSALVEVPTVIGWLRPVILLPASTLTGLAPTQLESILAHELAHVRRHDYLVNLLQRVIETLLFYHPAVWWVSNCIRAEREHCCDDLVVEVCGDRIGYARALTSLEALRSTASELALAADGGSLLQRIRRLLGAESGRARTRLWRVVALLVLGLTLVLIVDHTTAPTVFRSTLKVLVRPVRERRMTGTNTGATGDEHDPYRIQAEFARLTSRRILEDVVHTLNLQQRWALRSGWTLRIEDATDLLRQRVKITVPRGGSVFVISVESEDASEAENIATSLVDRYLKTRDWHSDDLVRAVLADRSDELRIRERKLREELIDFERNLPRIKESGAPGEIAEWEMRIDDLKRDITLSRETRGTLEKQIEEARINLALASANAGITIIDKHVTAFKRTALKRWFL